MLVAIRECWIQNHYYKVGDQWQGVGEPPGHFDDPENPREFEYKDMSLIELRRVAREFGVAPIGNKAELLERIAGTPVNDESQAEKKTGTMEYWELVSAAKALGVNTRRMRKEELRQVLKSIEEALEYFKRLEE